MYTTQMDTARKGIITEQIKTVAHKEGMEAERLRSLVASGKVAIPANKNHKALSPEGVGEGLRTKVNVNLGISKDCNDSELELAKAKYSIELKTDAIMVELLWQDARVPQEAFGYIAGYDRHCADV